MFGRKGDRRSSPHPPIPSHTHTRRQVRVEKDCTRFWRLSLNYRKNNFNTHKVIREVTLFATCNNLQRDRAFAKSLFLRCTTIAMLKNRCPSKERMQRTLRGFNSFLSSMWLWRTIILRLWFIWEEFRGKRKRLFQLFNQSSKHPSFIIPISNRKIDYILTQPFFFFKKNDNYTSDSH